MDYRQFCGKAAGEHDKINTVVVIERRQVAGAWARPGQYVPDPKTLERLLAQVEILLGMTKTNEGIYGEAEYAMVTHKKADFFFVPAGDQRILLVSVDRPYVHEDLEEKIRQFLKELSD